MPFISELPMENLFQSAISFKVQLGILALKTNPQLIKDIKEQETAKVVMR